VKEVLGIFCYLTSDWSYHNICTRNSKRITSLFAMYGIFWWPVFHRYHRYYL